MTTSQDAPVVLTVRGTLHASTPEGGRALHNDTAGSAPGIEAARALGDLSHKVYAPCAAAGEMSGTKPNELLFVDVWESPQGIQRFFGNAHVQAQGGQLFASKEPTVWMPAKGAFSFHLPAAASKNERFLGMIRVAVKSPDEAIRAFGENGMKHLRDARRRGQLSHEIFFNVAAPAGTFELLGLDLWTSLDGMRTHYEETMAGVAASFAQKPTTSVWEQAPGAWSEW